MASQGPNNPATFATSREGGAGIDWTNASSVSTSNNSYALTNFSSGSADECRSYFLDATNFGFSIPSGATIDGVIVEVERKCNATTFSPRDRRSQLIKGGAATGTNKASGTTWTTSDAYETYGGAADLWSVALNDTDVNASTFGLRFQCQSNATGKSGVNLSVDHIRITVHYTEGGAATKAPPPRRRMTRFFKVRG